MNYADGTKVGLGDRLWVSNGDIGTVVASMDTAEYGPEYPRVDWAELKTGILVLTDRGALVHFEEVHSRLLSKIGPN
jgi:hypothetical protein